MFNEKERLAYQSIKAPAQLRQKITAPRKRFPKVLYPMAAIAACFVLIVAGVSISRQNDIVINGQVLRDSVVFYDTAPATERAVTSLISVPIEIQNPRNTEISVTEGELSIEGSSPAQSITLQSNQIVWWQIEHHEDAHIYQMRISDSKGTQIVTLQCKNTKITVTKEKEK